MIDVVLT